MEKRYSAYEVNEADGYKILLVKNKDMLNKITEFILTWRGDSNF